jgi:hypothetical protein
MSVVEEGYEHCGQSEPKEKEEGTDLASHLSYIMAKFSSFIHISIHLQIIQSSLIWRRHFSPKLRNKVIIN